MPSDDGLKVAELLEAARVYLSHAWASLLEAEEIKQDPSAVPGLDELQGLIVAAKRSAAAALDAVETAQGIALQEEKEGN